MANVSRDVPVPGARGGFSLLELVTVIAVLGLMSGVIAPLASATISTARFERAQRDVETLTKVLRSFRSVTGTWPTLSASGNPVGIRMLVTGTALPPAGTWSASSTWEANIAAAGDLLSNHLVVNRPGGQVVNRYPTTGDPSWLGPFLDESPLDPWGRPYVLNVGSATSASGTADQKLWVISAGADGIFQTSVQAARSDAAQGDDVAAVAWMR